MTESSNPLKRSVSLPALTLFGLGTIIGAGIYVLIGEVVSKSGYLTPVAFLLACLIAGFSAFSYAELSARYPLAAGQAVYVDKAFSFRPLTTLIGLLMVFVAIVASATLARGFVGYLQILVNLDSHWIILLLVLAIGAIVSWGIRESAWVAALTTLVEIGGLLLIVWVARQHFADVPWVLNQALEAYPTVGWGGITAGAFLAFFAFLGFEDIVNVAEETHNPTRTLPLAIILSLLISALLYFTLALVMIASAPIDQLAGNPAPLALVYETVTGKSPAFMVFISITAVVNGTLIMMVMASRIIYGMGRQGWLPTGLSRVHPRTRTPLNSTLLITLLVLVFALWLPLDALAFTTSLCTLIVFFFINLALVVIKRREQAPTGITCFPIWMPLLGMLSSAGFILAQLLA